MGKEKCGEVLVWTKDEYLQFIETLKGKPASYYAFETLYWCGLRLGEMLALTPADFVFERKIIHVTKSFQRIKGEDIITPPKNEKGIRRVLMPDFYADKIQAYIDSLQLSEKTVYSRSRNRICITKFAVVVLIAESNEYGSTESDIAISVC